MNERYTVTPNKPTEIDFGTGLTATANIVEVKRAIPDDTAFHEARHVVASNLKIKMATNIPNGNAQGLTIPETLTLAGAGAAAAGGHDHVGHDLFVAKKVFGADEKTATAAGWAAIKGKEDLILEMATQIQENGTIYQSHVNKGVENVENQRAGIHEVIVKIKDIRGKGVQTLTLKSRYNQIELDTTPYSLPKAA